MTLTYVPQMRKNVYFTENWMNYTNVLCKGLCLEALQFIIGTIHLIFLVALCDFFNAPNYSALFSPYENNIQHRRLTKSS